MVEGVELTMKNVIILTAGILVLSLTACGNKTDMNLAESQAIERLESIAPSENDTLSKITADITSLVNFRYSDVDINNLEFISDDTKALMNAEIEKMGTSEYYDISDEYDRIYNSIVADIQSKGGTIHEDGSITYSDDVQSTPEVEEVTADEAEHQVIETEPSAVGTEPTINDTETVEESQEAATSESEANSETVIEGNTNIDTGDSETLEYATGKPPVSTDENGFGIDEDGNFVIEMTSNGDPRTKDIIDVDGNILWNAVNEDDLSSLTNEQNKEFLMAQKEMEERFNAKYSNIIADTEKQAQEITKQNEIANSDIEDGLGDPEVPSTSYDRVYNLNEYYTSPDVLASEDGTKHYIKWDTIVYGYNPEYMRYDYTLFGGGYYISMTDTFIPITAMRGVGLYDFQLIDYRLLDNGDIKLYYESRTPEGMLGYSLEVLGTIKDGKFVADDIHNFTDFYYSKG